MYDHYSLMQAEIALRDNKAALPYALEHDEAEEIKHAIRELKTLINSKGV